MKKTSIGKYFFGFTIKIRFQSMFMEFFVQYDAEVISRIKSIYSGKFIEALQPQKIPKKLPKRREKLCSTQKNFQM